MRADLKSEALRDASLDAGIPLDDPELVRRLARAFAMHPWVREVVSVTATHPAAADVVVRCREPVAMVLASGAAQAVMLAALGVAVLWFRWRALDPRLRPGRAWDILLVTSSAGFIIIGLWTLWQQLVKLLAMLA